MKAVTDIEVIVDDRGHSVASVMRCEAPLLFRVADEPGPVLVLSMVGGAAGPLGGDDLQLRLHVGEGARVVVRSVGATMVQPGASGASSTTDVHVVVEAGGHLDWWPEPTVSVVGSHHRTTTTIRLATDATLRWADEISLGRFGEPSGRLGMRQRLEIDGRAMVDQETEFGFTASAGAGANGDGRCVLSALLVGDDVPSEPSSTVRRDAVRGVFPVTARVALVTCIAASRHDPSFGLTV